MNMLESIARSEEALGLRVDEIAMRPENLGKLHEELIDSCPEYLWAYHEWERKFGQYVAMGGAA